jgi:hypothetical protein
MRKTPALQPLQGSPVFECTMGTTMDELVWPVSDTTKHIIFPGGGNYFWWQAGTIKALQEKEYLKHGDSMYGASAGSVSCVMAACKVDMQYAMEENFKLPRKSDTFTHGHLIEQWLHEILPNDCHITCSGKVNISITTITATCMPLHRKVINEFCSKQDLIDACLTSSHIPFFLDGNFSRTFHGHTCVDGSFLPLLHNTPWPESELLYGGNKRALMLYHRNDKELMKQHRWGVLQKLDKKSVGDMFDMGYNYGIRLLRHVADSGVPETLFI